MGPKEISWVIYPSFGWNDRVKNLTIIYNIPLHTTLLSEILTWIPQRNSWTPTFLNLINIQVTENKWITIFCIYTSFMMNLLLSYRAKVTLPVMYEMEMKIYVDSIKE